MLFVNNPFSLLSEAATADFLDPDVDKEVKDAVEELQDDLTTNVEFVDADDKETNNAVLTAESCPMWLGESGRYYVNLNDIVRICEAEEEATGEPADAGEVASDVVAANADDGATEDQLVIVAPADVAEEIIENCLMEAKCGKTKGKASKKANGLSKALKDLKAKGFKIATKKKK